MCTEPNAGVSCGIDQCPRALACGVVDLIRLGMVNKGRFGMTFTDKEKARVTAMYRECELRSISFEKPTN